MRFFDTSGNPSPTRIGGYASVTALLILLTSCASGAKFKLDPETRTFYDTARLVMTGPEHDIFNHLPDAESRREFIREFWDKRDPDPDTPENEFMITFLNRVAYANKRFVEGRPGIDTDRGRIYVFLGPPDKTEEFLFDQTEAVRGPVLWWIYYAYELGIEFVDAKGTGAYTINEISGDLFGAIDRAKLGALYDDQGRLARDVDFKAEYDRSRREIVVRIPGRAIDFFEGESGALRAEFEFVFYVYANGGAAKEKFLESRVYEGKAGDFEKPGEIRFTIPRNLPPGKSTLDVIVSSKGGSRLSRRIFEIKN